MHSQELQSATTTFGWRSSVPLTLLIALALTLYNWDYLTLPPYWDGAMSIYPAAIELSRSGFDLPHLLSLPGYADAGPNVHSLSLLTLVNAALFTVFGFDSSIYVVAHLLHILAAAIGVTALYDIALRLLPRLSAALVVAATSMWPLVMRQFGDIYLETPLFMFVALAARATLDHKLLQVAAFTTLAVWVKPSAGILVLAVTFYLLGNTRRRFPERVSETARTLALPVVIGAIMAIQAAPRRGGDLLSVLSESIPYLLHMPFTGILAIATALMLTLEAITPSRRRQEPAARICRAMLIAFPLFYLLLAILGRGTHIVPRYYILFVPFALVYVSASLHSRGHRATNLGLLALIPVLLLGQAGLVPARSNPFPALAERFDSGPEQIALHRDQLEAASQTNDGSPIYYWQYTHYLSRYPELGYTDTPIDNGFFVHDVLEGPVEEFRLPDRFRMLFDSPVLGGETLLQIWMTMEIDPTRSVDVQPISTEHFTTYLVTIDKVR